MRKKLLSDSLQNRLLSLSIFSDPKAGFLKKMVLPFLMLLFTVSGYSQMATETFEGNIPATWTLFGNGVGSANWGISNDGYLGGKAATINPSSETIAQNATAQYFLVTPPVSVPANGEIRFYSKRATDGANENITYQIRLSTASQPDINGFSVILESWEGSNVNVGADNVYEEKIIALPEGIPANLNVYIAFVAVNTQTGTVASGDAWFVDNVRVIESCRKVLDTDFMATAITPNSAQLNWVHSNASEFQILVLPQGDLPTGSGTTTGNVYNAQNLDENTDYDVYIKTVCDPLTASGWAGPFPFKTKILGTSCTDPVIVPNVMVQPFTISANLSSYVNTDVVYENHGTNCLPGMTENYLTGDKLFLSYTPTTTGLVTITQTALGGGECWNHYTGVLVYEGCANVGQTCIAGTHTETADVPARISNLLLQGGQTYIIVVSSNLSSGAGICFNLQIEGSACAAPAVYTYKDLQQTSVSFSWDNVGGLSSGWEYAVQESGTGAPTGAGTATNTNVNNLINSGLAAGTAYDLYVRSVCNGTPGNWGLPYAFTTQCAAFNVPYVTGFLGRNEENPEPCWTSVDVNNDGTTWKYAEGWDVPNYVTITGNQNFNNDILASPQVIFDGTPKRIRFKQQVPYGTAKYSIRLSTTGVGATNFTVNILPETEITNTEWQEKIINLPTGITGNVNIAWIVSPGTGSDAPRISFTDVYIENKPACPDPIAPTAEDMTARTARLLWTNGDVETQWQVAIQPLGTGVPTGSGELVDSNPHLAENLLPATRYEYYVRAYCDATHQSEWVGPFAFTTLCESFPTPFFESFNDDDANTQKFCWSINDVNADETVWTVEPEYPSIRPSSSWFNPTTSFDDWLISPAINAVGVKQLKFKYRAAFSIFAPRSRFGVEVMISTTDNNPASFTVLSPLMVFSNTDFIEKTVYFNGTGNIYIAFRVPPEYSLTEGSSILQIDDVSITDAGACPNPSELTVANITSSQAALSWHIGYDEQAWDVAVQLAGSGIPTGNGVRVTAANYLPNTLNPDTEYEYYVRASCGTSNSDWIGPLKFRTLCSPFNTPFLETFNTDSTTEACWRVLNANDDGNQWNMNVTVNPYEGNQMAGMFTGTNGANDDYLISPTINVTANQRLRFYYKVYHSDFTEDLEIRLSTTGIDLAGFTTVLYDSAVETVLINNIEFKEMIINLPAGITGNINIAWRIQPMEPSWMGYRGQLLFIDSVIVEDIPPCANVSNPVVTIPNIRDTAFDISWTANGTETSWEISVQPYGTPAPSGNTLPEYLYTATTNPFTVTGLTPATKYEYYIRARCSDALQSEWVGPFTVVTKCSFENLCEYTITLSGAGSGGVGGGINVIQNGYVIQTLEFPTGAWNEVPEPVVFPIFFCKGVEFSLYWDAVGTAPGQFAGATVTVTNGTGEVVSTTDLGDLAAPRSTFFTGIATCGTISCPQPTNLVVSDQSVFTWTPGSTETSWEVFIQPVGNNTLPQSGTVVTAATYTPQASDFNSLTATTYEYFVRAICGAENTSFWSGPKVFVRNDSASTAMRLEVNTGELCNVSASDVTFAGATVSADAMSCTTANGGDIWFEFDATSRIHIIEANGFTGNFYISSGDEEYPNMTMTLYHVTTGGLVELTCSNNNSIVAMHSSELVVGDTYKIRLSLNTSTYNSRKFNVCITTPTDLCKVNAVNYDFETPPMQAVTGITTISTQYVVPGWRTNLDTWESLFFAEALNAINFTPYSGGQCIQLLSDPEEDWDPNDPNIKGLYKDFDTSETTQMDYSFAHATRAEGNVIQLYAGPKAGPFVLIREEPAVGLAWTLHTGKYDVPTGQTNTRFIFRTKENKIGNLLDVANFIDNNKIETLPVTLACDQRTTFLKAEGVGTWSADASNPAATTIATPNAKQTNISGFITAGVYTYHWKTRYCDYTVTVTYQGFDVVPTVTSPVAYCLNAPATPLTATPTTGYTLLWFTEETGGTGSVNAPTPDTSAIANTTYYVANVNEAGCVGTRVPIFVTINDNVVKEVGFRYDAAQFCKIGANPVITLNPGFALGGSFTATPLGLDIDINTGAISLANSTPAVYQISYNVGGIGCAGPNGSTIPLTVTAATEPTLGFSYTTPVCVGQANQRPIQPTGFPTTGSYSSTTLTVNATTGEIDMATAIAGSHQIVYNVAALAATCTNLGTQTFTVIINAPSPAVTGFTFSPSYCLSQQNPLPTMATGHTPGGRFESTAGLAIDPVSGEINLSASTEGSYAITYTVEADPANCITRNSSSFNVSIGSGDFDIAVTDGCEGKDLMLKAAPVNNSFDPATATYVWKDASGTAFGDDSESFNVTTYVSQNPNAVFPIVFTVEVTAGGCSDETNFTVSGLRCLDFPKGISPNGDEYNQNFDLTGFGVKHITIFNRYGTEVFSFNGTYTNQWHGQSKDGQDLPSATYFYSANREDGSTVTGWVYINR